jgi:hypothetical protein
MVEKSFPCPLEGEWLAVSKSKKNLPKSPVHLAHLDHANIFNGFCGPGIFGSPGYYLDQQF